MLLAIIIKRKIKDWEYSLANTAFTCSNSDQGAGRPRLRWNRYIITRLNDENMNTFLPNKRIPVCPYAKIKMAYTTQKLMTGFNDFFIVRNSSMICLMTFKSLKSLRAATVTAIQIMYSSIWNQNNASSKLIKANGLALTFRRSLSIFISLTIKNAMTSVALITWIISSQFHIDARYDHFSL